MADSACAGYAPTGIITIARDLYRVITQFQNELCYPHNHMAQGVESQTFALYTTMN
ncbi:hypothetical protein FTUN_5429 [Frigoriglobus tundricola]|uniref:Uncharacterized protein n=1 Tax=Frigoriglobus tundricola TaxID=2774151 RepID=A0A6M5YV75_9BACT|nr:hypothetical protein FTUN_5429 [Frigoriglobus tundricola]